MPDLRSETTAPARAAGRWEPPREFDDYVVVRPLGSGGMGQVYLAEDTVLARHVAVKFIGAEPDTETRQRFLIEARAAARIQHPNVVTIYRVGHCDDHPYIVTEFVRGQTLEKLKKPILWTQALDLGIQLARGLAAAHRKGVLHCDIKPANAVVTDEGEAKLLDFGLATLVQMRKDSIAPELADRADFDSGVNDAGRTVVGTPDFIAPEIWRLEPATGRSDVFSLGAVLYELCSGRAPFQDVRVDDLPRVAQERDVAPLAEVGERVDPRFAAIVERCLRRAARDRYASGDELRAALEQLSRAAIGAPVPEGNPYRGLRAFEKEQRGLFFGRSAEINAVIDRLRVESLVLVTGDSGVGKSSLCRAGVLPALSEGALGDARTWTAVTLVPGKRPLANLSAALAPKLDADPRVLAEQIAADGTALAHHLAKHAGATRGIVIFVDQTEELVTVAGRVEADAVEAALAELGPGLHGVRVIATLRADFLTRFAALPTLGEDLSRLLYFLRPLSPERIRDVIVGPADATGTRFESDELVQSLVDATAQAQGGLPLLQFALAELWEGRNADGVITAAALSAMGGVAGALARHADTVLASMKPNQRIAARRVLMRLVTLDNTRARRTDNELNASDPAVRGALDAMVRGRLLIASEAEDGSAYEIAHEVLVRSWETLGRWLAEDAELRGARERLAVAATDWRRHGRARDLLWNARQLVDIAALDEAGLTTWEMEFLTLSRFGARRTRWVRRVAAASFPLALIAVYTGAQLKTRREIDARVELRLSSARAATTHATEARDAWNRERISAYRMFDAQQRDEAEKVWSSALSNESTAEHAFAEASRYLEAALAQDAARPDIRGLLADALYERAVLAEQRDDRDAVDELVQRFGLYDDGKRAHRWNALADIEIKTTPQGASVSVGQYVLEGKRLILAPDVALGTTPISHATLERGSYRLTVARNGGAVVYVPLLVERGETVSLDLAVPPKQAVPDGFVFVPAGRFLFGSAGDEPSRRGFFGTVPRHELRTGAFLIQLTEVTFRDYLVYLGAIPAAEQKRRMPRIENKVGQSGALELRTTADGVWELRIQPADRLFVARAGEAIRDERRSRRAARDWLAMPVAGVSGEDAEAYAAWLAATGRVPGARLCSELEWERAARGADGRTYPHGFALAADDANVDDTYGQTTMGLDEVGSHPISRSPFGLDDMSGNAFEWTRGGISSARYVVRGGSYFHDQKTAQLVNRTETIPTLRDATLGFRLCADWPS